MTTVRKRLLAAAAAVAVALGLFVGVQPGGVDVTGTLEVAHTDDFVNPPTVLSWVKTDDGKRVALAGHEHDLAPGSRVHVHGNRVAAVGGVETLAPATIDVLAAPAAATLRVRNIAVLLVNFTDDPTAQPYTAAAVDSLFFGPGQSVKNYFEEEARGTVTVTGHVFDWRTIADVSTSGCPFNHWGDLAQQGLDLTSYTNIVVAWPWENGATGCSFAGAAYVPGTMSFNNGSMGLRVVSHELSHNFGVMHASSLQCTSGGVPVALSGTCTYQEYGDPCSIMGLASHYHAAASMVGQMGWLAPTEVQTVTNGTFQVWPLLQPGPVKLLRVARGDGTWLYLDIRAVTGIFDAFSPADHCQTGISIRLSPDEPAPGGRVTNSKLVDTHPETPTADAALDPGRTITDLLSGITITTDSVVAGGPATITIAGAGPGPSPTAAATPQGGPTPTPTPTPVATPSPSPFPTPTPRPTATPQPPGSVVTIGTASRSQGGNGSLSLDITRAVPANDTVAVAVSVGTFAGAVVCRDSRGNAYTVNVDVVGRLFICSARLATALSPGDTITSTYPAFSGLSLAVAVDAGILGPFRGKATATGNSISPSVGPIVGNAIGAISYGATPTFAVRCGTLVTELAGGAGSVRKVIEVLSGPQLCGTLSAARPWQAVVVGFGP